MTTAAPQRPRVPRRALDGVLLLDKPVGLSSNDALIRAKRLLLAKKAGHTGTLDPLASGLLPLCFGEATKFSQDLLEADKTYEATMRLGVRTTTGDTEGDVLDTRAVECDRAAVEAALARFTGEIVQVPPMYSALKRDGKPLYEYARAGQTVEREGRNVTIHALDLLACELPDVTFRVTCSKGTYVRTLAEDIGEALGCGAHLTMLRRTGVGALTLEHAVTLDALSDAAEAARDAWLQPVDALLSTFPLVRLDETSAKRFLHGQRLPLSALDSIDAAEGERVRVYDAQRLLGVARKANGVLAPERLVVTAA
ncbi:MULTISPECIES: tRNA pseudouridine(55) synthase TruB [unclassified Burkholderia]|uniref:tRNA pseudouridine(55) synthase TruB n=1 Tax=unclassified Burkholderia TaxID=2613784 RepID=UPI000F56125E|nr:MULTISPECIES: tRNA pseudouridine(55) synthase TruB [unclassified Burkholderia]RQR37461.1 tRNA pseudouridine(55) synthase TruB [Burkholderia sp. Bp9131]RQR67534.1 tRNA pseudouridine(55) synthase TruB [Burkholderia sp. Bp9015]RQS00099.1 tRNA pseudouridine(55) synthase TruB [Burkholderia sp. Bp8994]RQS21647.1 tRNA pseudouridine(55) synthase TruB [Burkholderia sp. Bp8995]RQS34317.1 tRNA pseudouridine(55) synthase TruB [Burkholderia sp. Bp8990]